jgi:hypothetical protein
VTETTEPRLRDLPAAERREAFLDQLYAKLDDPELPAHVYSRITASITALEKLIAQEAADEKPSGQQLGPALAAMPIEHAQEILLDEIQRLRLQADGYADQLAELVGAEAAREALAAV